MCVCVCTSQLNPLVSEAHEYMWADLASPVRCPLLSWPPKSCSRSVGMMHSSLGTGPSTEELVMCMLVVMPLMVPSPLSPQPVRQVGFVFVCVHVCM